jgi:hypothetical protein
MIIFDWRSHDRLQFRALSRVRHSFLGDSGTLFASGIVNFLVKISDKVVNADIVSSPMVAKGMSGLGCFKASGMSWAAIEMRSEDDI